MFGGRALTVTGMGKFIENVCVYFPFDLITYGPRVSIIELLVLMPVSLESLTGYIFPDVFSTVLAGAEDVLGDLGVRQALKKMPRDARL